MQLWGSGQRVGLIVFGYFDWLSRGCEFYCCVFLHTAFKVVCWKMNSFNQAKMVETSPNPRVNSIGDKTRHTQATSQGWVPLWTRPDLDFGAGNLGKYEVYGPKKYCPNLTLHILSPAKSSLVNATNVFPLVQICCENLNKIDPFPTELSKNALKWLPLPNLSKLGKNTSLDLSKFSQNCFPSHRMSLSSWYKLHILA